MYGDTSTVGAPPAGTTRVLTWAVDRYAAGVAAITGVAFLVRVVLLGSVPRFWGDEAFTAVQVRKPLGAMLTVISRDSHPPLFYFLLRGVALVSTGPAAMRSVSAIAGTAAVVLAAALGRRVAGNTGGLLSAAALAGFPAYVFSSRDGRGYMLASCLALAAVLALWRAVERPSQARLAVYGLAVLAAVYTHYFDVLAVVTALSAALVMFRPPRSTVVKLCATCAAGMLPLVPWVLFARAQLQHLSQRFWLQPMRWGPFLSDVVARLRSAPLQEFGQVSAWLSIVAGLGLLVAVYRRVGPAQRRGVLYLLACSVIPTLALLVSAAWLPFYADRYAAIFWGTAAVLLGAAFAVLGRAWVGIAACATLGAVGILGVLFIQRADFQQLVGPLRGHVAASDIVALDGPEFYYPMAYFGDAEVVAALRVIGETPPWFEGTAGFPAGTVVPKIPAPERGLYVLEDPRARALLIPAGFREVDHRCRDGLCVDHYTR